MRIAAIVATLIVASVASAQERPTAEQGEPKKKQPEAVGGPLRRLTARPKRSATGRSSARRLGAAANAPARSTRQSFCAANPPPLHELQSCARRRTSRFS
jgi:hypothetical protein